MMYSHKGGGPDVGNGKTGGPQDEPLVAGSPPGEDELVTEHEHMPFILRYSTLISRLFGVITLTVLWSLTVLTLNDLSKYNAYAPWYLLAISLLTTFFELIWLFNKCATCRVGLKESQYDDSVSLTYDEIDLSRKNNCCCRCWRLMLWVDNWRKALLYVVFGVPMFVRNLVTVYTVICGLLLLILAALYFIKSFKESKCVARKPRKHSYVQTSNAPKPKYVQHPVQTYTGDYPPASHGYDSLGHTNSIQPPEYTQHPEQPKPQSQGTNYFRPFKDGVGNVQEEPNGSIPREPERNREIGGSIDGKRKSPEAKQKGVTERPSSSASPSVKSKDPNKSTSKDMTKEKSSPKEVSEKPRGSSTEEGGFKLFGLRKKDEKPKEQVVTMVSSQRSVEEDLEQYPEDKNPFDDDEEDCEWDPNNRGQS